MKAHLFLQSSTLFVTTETIPQPRDFNYFEGGICKYDSVKYADVTAQIKSRGVVVGNVKVDGPDGLNGYEVYLFNSRMLLHADTLYPIKCEVRYECCSKDVKLADDCTGPHCNNHKTFRAILSPISPVVSKEETQDNITFQKFTAEVGKETQEELWGEVYADIELCRIHTKEQQSEFEEIALKSLKSRFTITRNK